MSQGKLAASIVITATVAAILSIIFWVPYVYCKVVRKDYSASGLVAFFFQFAH
jgi:sodium-dependent phosphate transporter